MTRGTRNAGQIENHSKTADVAPGWAVTTVKTSKLNNPIKRLRLVERIRKYNPTIQRLQRQTVDSKTQRG